MKNVREMIKNNIGKIRSVQQEVTMDPKQIKEHVQSVVKAIYAEYGLPLDESYKEKVNDMYSAIMDDLKAINKQ